MYICTQYARTNIENMATRREIALQMIPVLIRWAQATWDKPHYYKNLSDEIGYKSNQTGAILGFLHKQIIKTLPIPKGKDAPPTLNALVQNMKTGLPSEGFDEVVPNYSKLSAESQRGEVRRLNYEAHIYDWSWVLKALNLKPAKLIDDKELAEIKKSGYGSGGEGIEHETIKNFILKNPESVGVKGVKFSEPEHPLYSGDKLDVYFECKRNIHYAIEVKPKSSPKGDILRGIFQCVKYKSVMDATRVLDNKNYENYTLLVLAGRMPVKFKHIADDLGVDYIENFKID